MYCGNCGNQLEDNAQFCSKCGAKIKRVEYVADTASIPEQPQSYNYELKPASTPKTPMEILCLVGFVAGLIGAILFAGIVIVSLIGWGEIYLFGGYEFTAVLATISLVLMAIGIVLNAIHIINRKKGTISLEKPALKIVSIILVVCIIFSIIGVGDAIAQNVDDSDDDYNYGGGSSGTTYKPSYSTTISASLGLKLTVDSIKTSSNYTYVYCTVKNVSSTYGSATRYRYVKVKGVFKDRYGSIVDTDWTYAVDSTWIEPGESKQFYFMVRDTSVKSATLSIISD